MITWLHSSWNFTGLRSNSGLASRLLWFRPIKPGMAMFLHINMIYFLPLVQQDRCVRLHKICFVISIITLKVGPLQWPPQARLLNALSLAVKNSNSVDTFKRQPNLFICKLPTCFPILNLLTGVRSFIIVKRPKTINYCYYYYCHYCYY